MIACSGTEDDEDTVVDTADADSDTDADSDADTDADTDADSDSLDAVLVSGVGQTPFDILSKSGVKPVEAAGFIEEGLRTVYENRKASSLKGRRSPCADGSCSGSGGGCG